MKKITLFLWIVFSNFQILCQESPCNDIIPSDTQEAILLYKDLLIEYGEKFHSEYNKVALFNRIRSEITEKEIRRITKTYLGAYFINPLEVKMMIRECLYRNETEANGDNELYGKFFYKSFGVTQKYLRKILQQKLDSLNAKLVLSDLILRGKVLSKRNYNSGDEEYNFIVTELDLLVEESIRGNAKIDSTKKITVFYNNDWIKRPDVTWKIGESYLFIAQYRYDDDQFIHSLITGDGNYFFKIVDEKLYDENAWFKRGKVVNWEEFSNEMKSRIESLTE